MTPSCCIRLRVSRLAQRSTALPSAMRAMIIPGTENGLPVGGMPMKSPVGTLHRVAERHLVLFAEDVREREVQIGESVADGGDGPSVAFGPWGLPREGRVVHVVGGEISVHGRQVPLFQTSSM